MRQLARRYIEARIGRWRLKELMSICRQYREDKRAIEYARQGIVDRRRPSGAWRRPDPTGNAAINVAAMPEQRRVKIIEQSAAAVAEPVMAEAILKSVTEGIPYEKLRRRPPCGRNQFRVQVQLFFIELDARLWADE